MIGSEGVAVSAGFSGVVSGLVSVFSDAGAGDSVANGEPTGEGCAVALLAAVSGFVGSVFDSAFSVTGATRRVRDDVAVVGDSAGFACDRVLRFGLVFCANANGILSVDMIARATSVLRILIDKYPKKCG
jgi:hypothetical protein